MPHIIRIIRTAFVDPSWWRPKHDDDQIITDPVVVAAWRDRLKSEKDCCETKFRTQLVREIIQDNTQQNGVPRSASAVPRCMRVPPCPRPCVMLRASSPGDTVKVDVSGPKPVWNGTVGFYGPVVCKHGTRISDQVPHIDECLSCALDETPGYRQRQVP